MVVTNWHSFISPCLVTMFKGKSNRIETPEFLKVKSPALKNSS